MNSKHQKVVSFTQKTGARIKVDSTKNMHEPFQNSVHRSRLIFIFLCPPSEDETSELCLGLHTLLDLKVSFVCDCLISVCFRDLLR